MKTNKYILYTDGACSGNPGKGGWAAIAFNEEGDNIMQHSGGYRKTTNNRMEIIAVTNGLASLKEQIENSRDKDSEIVVYSDSQLVVNTVNLGWSKKSNKDLWCQLDSTLNDLKSLGVKVSFVKVKGHSDNKGNILADEVAVFASQNAKDTDVDHGYENPDEKEPTGRLFTDPEPTIKSVMLNSYDTPKERNAVVTLSNGSVITISPLYEASLYGFQQTGGTQREMRVTVDLAFKLNRWLHGGEI